jgi:hypothetical protein
MFSRPIKRIVCMLLAICLATASAIASAESHNGDHKHDQEVATATDVLNGSSQPHDHANDGDCGIGECMTCHLFCHASAILPYVDNIVRPDDTRLAFIEVETGLSHSPLDRIERPNW